MKVCFVGGARYSQPLDATSRKKWQLLSQLGDMFVIAFSRDFRPRHFKEYATFYLLPQWPLPILRYLTMFTVGPILALWTIYRHGVQVLVAQSPYEGFAAAIAKVLARLSNRQVVLVIENHADFEKSLFLQRRVRWPGVYRNLMRLVSQFSLRHADLLRAVSAFTRKQLETWAPGKPIVQFVAWTDIEAFLHAGDRHSKEGSEIVYAGVLIPRKGIHHLIAAFHRIASEVQEAQLILIGKPINPEYADQLRRMVIQNGLEGRVEFIGEVDQIELARRMARARVVVLPSLSEGLGRVVFEAMATGTPVIGSRVDGIPEMVEDGKTGFLVPPGDEEALAQRLRWVLEHPEEAEEMGRRAREFARSFFSAEAYLAGYQNLFQMAQKMLEAP